MQLACGYWYPLIMVASACYDWL